MRRAHYDFKVLSLRGYIGEATAAPIEPAGLRDGAEAVDEC
jgi:hypothetical protein